MPKNPFEKFLVYAIKIGIFITLFLPLLVTDSFYFPYITGKNFSFRIIVEIISFFYLLLILKNKNYRPRFSIVAIMVTLFFVATAIATFTGVNPYHSFWGNYERMIGLIGYIHYFLFFLILIGVFKSYKDWLNIFKTSVFVSVLVNLYALAQNFEWFGLTKPPRLDGTFGNPLYLGAFIILNIFFIIYFLIKSASWPKLIGWLSLFVFEFYIMLGTLSRGPILALVGGIILFLILILLIKENNNAEQKLKKPNLEQPILSTKSLKILSTCLLITVCLMLVIIFIFKNSRFVQDNPYLSRITNLSLQEDTIKSRLQLQGIALKGIKERPVFGWGPENFYYLYNKYYDPKMYASNVFYDRAHNMIVDVTAESGFVGVSIYVLIFIFAIYAIIKMLRKRENSLFNCAILSTLFGYFIQNLSVFDNLTSFVIFFIILAYLNFCLNNDSVNTEEFLAEQRHKQVSGGITPSQITSTILAFVMMVYFIYTFNIKPMIAANDTVTAYQAASINDAMGLFKQALDLGTFGNPEITIAAADYFFQISDKFPAKDQEAMEVKNNFENFLATALISNLQKDPQEFKTFLTLAKIYQYEGDYNKTADALLKAIDLSPSKQSTYTQLAEIYAQQNNYAKALELSQEAINIEPSNKDPHLTLAMIYLSKKDLANAQNQFQVIQNITEQQTQQMDPLAKRGIKIDDLYKMAKIYASFNYPSLAEPAFKEIIILNPNSSQAYFDLAYFYYTYNQRQLSLNVLNELLLRDPTQKEKIDQFTQQFNLLK